MFTCANFIKRFTVVIYEPANNACVCPWQACKALLNGGLSGQKVMQEWRS